MKVLKYLLVLLCLTGTALAKVKEFTVSGGEKIKAKYEHGMPLPAENAGIKIEAAAFNFGDGKLTFAFDFSTGQKLQKVVVEDVTASTAVLLVEDAAPTVRKNLWSGEAAPLAISRTTVPWLYESGDTTKVFRFTVMVAGQSKPVVLYQPSVYSGAVKKQLRQMMP